MSNDYKEQCVGRQEISKAQKERLHDILEGVLEASSGMGSMTVNGELIFLYATRNYCEDPVRRAVRSCLSSIEEALCNQLREATCRDDVLFHLEDALGQFVVDELCDELISEGHMEEDSTDFDWEEEEEEEEDEDE
jgi:hypothetical protein